MKICWEDIVFSRGLWALIVLGLIGAFIFWGLPVLQQNKADRDYAHAVISDVNYSFNDSVAMVKYNYGFWGGLSGIDSTTVTLLHGTNATLRDTSKDGNISAWDIWNILLSNGNLSQNLSNQTITEFTFSGNLDVHSGDYCQVTYSIITHRDNATDVNSVTIQVLSATLITQQQMEKEKQ